MSAQNLSLISRVPHNEPARGGVLVADDEPLIRWALHYALESTGFEVTLAATRDEACDLLAARRFDVVVMADALGAEAMADVLDMVARFHAGSGLVVLDGGESPGALRDTLPSAVFVDKPFSLDTLTATIAGFCHPEQEAC